MKRRRIFFITLATLVFLSRGAAPLFAQMVGGEEAGRNQADAFLAQAAQALDSGSAVRARPLLESALELSPRYSEALYLRARLELADRSSTLAAIADLRAALKQGTWKSTDPAAAEQALGEVLLRAGRLSEARPILERLVSSHPEDSRNTLLLARVFAKAGDTAREQNALSGAAVRFPLVDDFRLLSAALFERQGRSETARNVIAVGLKVHPESLPLMLASARLERTAKARQAAVDLYLARGGGDPLGPVIALEASPRDRQKYLDQFLAEGGLAHQDLVDRVAVTVRGRKELAASLQNALTLYTGTRDLDADQDGFWEDRWTFDKGELTDWVREPAQDGVAQYAARFGKGEPVSLAYSPRSDVKVTLTFSRYPFIESAAEKPGGTLFLVPYTLQCAFLQPAAAGVPGLAPRVAAGFRTPTLEQLQKGAYRREEYSQDGTTLIRRSELSRGQTIYVEEDTDGDGRLDHRLWFQNGLPVRGERSPTGDGVFPIKETWRGGRLVGETTEKAQPRHGGHDNFEQGGAFVRELAVAVDRQGVTYPEAEE